MHFQLLGVVLKLKKILQKFVATNFWVDPDQSPVVSGTFRDDFIKLLKLTLYQ